MKQLPNSIYELEFGLKVKLCSVWIKKPCYNCGIKNKHFWLVKTYSFTATFLNIIKRKYCLVCCFNKTELFKRFDGYFVDSHLRFK